MKKLLISFLLPLLFWAGAAQAAETPEMAGLVLAMPELEARKQAENIAGQYGGYVEGNTVWADGRRLVYMDFVDDRLFEMDFFTAFFKLENLDLRFFNEFCDARKIKGPMIEEKMPGGMAHIIAGADFSLGYASLGGRDDFIFFRKGTLKNTGMAPAKN